MFRARPAPMEKLSIPGRFAGRFGSAPGLLTRRRFPSDMVGTA